jgi:hypothetical protein
MEEMQMVISRASQGILSEIDLKTGVKRVRDGRCLQYRNVLTELCDIRTLDKNLLR